MRFRIERSFYVRPTDQPVPSELDPSVAVAYIRQSQTSRGDRWEYLCFRGRAAKPAAHYLAKSKEQAVSEIVKFYQDEAQRLARMAQRREQRKADHAKAKAEFAGKPGSIYVQSWGWEQTNITAFQMVRRVSQSTIEAVRIGLDVADGEWKGPMSDHVTPCQIPQAEAEADPEKIIMRIAGPDSVLVPRTEGYAWGRHANQWDGRRAYYRSWYA